MTGSSIITASNGVVQMQLYPSKVGGNNNVEQEEHTLTTLDLSVLDIWQEDEEEEVEDTLWNVRKMPMGAASMVEQSHRRRRHLLRHDSGDTILRRGGRRPMECHSMIERGVRRGAYHSDSDCEYSMRRDVSDVDDDDEASTRSEVTAKRSCSDPYKLEHALCRFKPDDSATTGVDLNASLISIDQSILTSKHFAEEPEEQQPKRKSSFHVKSFVAARVGTFTNNVEFIGKLVGGMFGKVRV